MNVPAPTADLAGYLERPPTPADPALLAAVDSGPIDPAEALPLAQIDRLTDPAPLAAETGWCMLDDGVGYIAVRTEMPPSAARWSTGGSSGTRTRTCATGFGSRRRTRPTASSSGRPAAARTSGG